MNKRLNLFFCVGMISVAIHAQWTQKDSLNLRRMLSGDEEMKLNPEAVKKIDFGSFKGKPMSVDEKPALKYDATLPKVFPDRDKAALTLRPYTVHTKYNYDPIYRMKIKVNANTWRSDPFLHLYQSTIPTNWAKTPADPGIRKSLEEIEATGLRYNPLAERVNNKYVGAWQPTGGGGISGDLMAPFTKEFWNVKGRKRRARTLEVLSHYGDSTTVQLNEEIKKAVIH